MPLFGGITTAVGLGLSAYQIAKSAKDKKKYAAEAEKTLYGRPKQQNDPAIQEQLNAARARVGAPDPAIGAAYGQLQQQQANQLAYLQRNAPSGAVALAGGAATTANTQSILPALAGQQTAYNERGLANLNQALQGQTEQNRMIHQDALGAYGDIANYQLGRVGAAQQEKSQAIALGTQSLLSGLNTYGQIKAAKIATPTYTPDYGAQRGIAPGGMLAGANTISPYAGHGITSGIAGGLSSPNSAMGVPTGLDPAILEYYRKYKLYQPYAFNN